MSPRAVFGAALLAAPLASSCSPSATPADAGLDGGGVCSGASTPDVQGLGFSCELLVGRSPCTFCLQMRSQEPDAGSPDVYTVYPGTCTCP